jgi:glycine cleavage system H protein
MSEIREGLNYTKTDEWVKVAGNIATVGITDYAQTHLGDIVFVELKEGGVELKKGDVLTTIESVKSASDIYSPVSGRLIEMNKALEANPGLINKEPYDGGWIAKIEMKNPEEIKDLMNSEKYSEAHKE